jgi:23S rRNA (adenine1618-N6)-methyltransferase
VNRKNKKSLIPRNAPAVSALHPRNRHQGLYDFARLIEASPGLGEFVIENADAESSIDFSNPEAVKALNRALLISNYGIQTWNIPQGSLCPSVPGRADYLHYLADLLAGCNSGVIPKSKAMRGLDVGTGASCIYPIIGYGEYGWNFVASDINATSLANAQAIIDMNPPLANRIELRLQASPSAYFKGIVGDDDWFDFSVCNPPFHASATAAREATQRKWQNLGKATKASETPPLNFGGHHDELCCPGGEQAFIQGMIAESALIPTRCFWFSSLVSKTANLAGIYAALTRAKVCEYETLAMSQGQKKSRLVAWTFLSPAQRAAWRKLRW